MLHNVNHHTDYSYSKFTTRPPYLIALERTPGLFKANRNKSQRLEFKTIKFKPGFNGLFKKSPNQKTIEKKLLLHQRPLSTGESNNIAKFTTPKLSVVLSQQTGFRTRELLCWRSDSGFFNLRTYFLNSLKALHLCWSAVRNNKRIAFVGLNQGLSLCSLNALVNNYVRTKSYTRDTLPRTTALLNTTSLVAGVKSAQIKQSTVPASSVLNTNTKPQYLLLAQLTRLINASYSGVREQVIGSKTANHKSTSAGFIGGLKKQLVYRRLQAKMAQASSKVSITMYPNVRTGFFSNPEKPFKNLFNHWSLLNDEHGFVPNRGKRGFLTTGLQAYSSLFKITRLHPNTVAPLATMLIEKSHSRPVVFQNLTNFFVKDPRKAKSRSYAQNIATVIKSEIATLKLRLVQLQSGKPNHCYNNATNIKTFKAYNNEARGKFCFFHRMLKSGHYEFKKKNAVVSRKTNKGLQKPNMHFTDPSTILTQHYLSPFQKGQKQDYYATVMFSNLVKDYQLFASNPNNKQADLIFFVHPDKTPRLAQQAKCLRVPTIGIVSGLKSNSELRAKRHNNQIDSVSHPILGNPENAFFVVMVVRNFMNLIKKAYNSVTKTSGSARFKPDKPSVKSGFNIKKSINYAKHTARFANVVNVSKAPQGGKTVRVSSTLKVPKPSKMLKASKAGNAFRTLKANSL